jgi:hypothetical protein
VAVLARLRTTFWRRLGFRLRAVGITLLAIAAFVPLPGIAVAALAAPGLLLLTAGSIVWLARDADSWRR